MYIHKLLYFSLPFTFENSPFIFQDSHENSILPSPVNPHNLAMPTLFDEASEGWGGIR